MTPKVRWEPRQPVILDSTALVLGVLGHTEGEYTAVAYADPAEGDKWHTKVAHPADALAWATSQPDTANVFFTPNPVAGPAREDKGRGKETDVTRLAALFCDLDVDGEKFQSIAQARAVVARVGARLHMPASVIVRSGHGVHAYWPISDGWITTDHDRGAALALVRRFGRLVKVEAKALGASADNVFQLSRAMRLPGSFNNKSVGNGQCRIEVVAEGYGAAQ